MRRLQLRRSSVAEKARIYVIAGVNGAGKSSVVGAWIRENGAEYFNPDERTKQYRTASPDMSENEANSRAWNDGKAGLEEAIRDRQDYVFETTLGGATLAKLLFTALDRGLEVSVFYVGLAGVELHLERIRARVAAGGHAIPETKVRERYVSSMKNLVQLAPRLTELTVYDNSAVADPKTGERPAPMEILHAVSGTVVRYCELSACPDWAKPVLAVLLRDD
jgi:predicted ABC-type ATPase